LLAGFLQLPDYKITQLQNRAGSQRVPNLFKRQEMKAADAYRKEKVAFCTMPKVICSQEARLLGVSDDSRPVPPGSHFQISHYSFGEKTRRKKRIRPPHPGSESSTWRGTRIALLSIKRSQMEPALAVLSSWKVYKE
jgi:hypothetical protein